MSPAIIVPDKLRSCSAAIKIVGNADHQETGRWLNHWAENFRLPFRCRQRTMLRFHRMRSLQKFVAAHASVYTLFNLKRADFSRTNFKLN
ncbi:hypothetical protein [Octadecabacter antarcticus]|uniref:hypothetical protein n=1 Tax=Octadecabacter antarcticus TaxID=1217908 RepID=UPI002FDDA3DA